MLCSTDHGTACTSTGYSTVQNSSIGNISCSSTLYPEHPAAIKAVQLASLSPFVPHVSLDRLGGKYTLPDIEAFEQRRLGGKCTLPGMEEIKQRVLQLQVGLFTVPLLRALLALTGHLSVEHKRGLTVLLGGGDNHTVGAAEGGSSGSASSSSRDLMLPEPPALAAARQQDNISLADLSMGLVWALCMPSVKQLCNMSIAEHLSSAFGSEQLPFVIRSTQLWKEGKAPDAELDKFYPGVAQDYLAWLQESLLAVINEVVSRPQVRAQLLASAGHF
jgi:hypothetical protein